MPVAPERSHGYHQWRRTPIRDKFHSVRMADDSNSAPPSPAGDAASRPSPGAPSQADDADAGRPIARDEIDPELISLPRLRGRIGPLLAASMVVFSVYLLLRLTDDLAFSRQGHEPAELESPAALLAQGDIDNRYVRMPAAPDRAFAARMQVSRANQGSRLAPAQGSNDRLWLMIDGSVWTAGILYEEVYAGRVRELDDLPFAEPLRQHVAQRPPAPRFVTPGAVRTALTAAAGTVASPAGDAIAVSAETPVHVYQTAPDRVRIEAIPTERLPDAAAWSRALTEIGVGGPEATAARPEAMPGGPGWLFTVPATGDVEAIETALRDARLVPAARVLPLEIVHETTWGQLAARDDALMVAGTAVPWSQISWVTPIVPRVVPEVAWVLVADESPASYWYVLPLCAVLGIAALLFTWGLARVLWPRADEAMAAPPAASA
jgi:hypothetical protein